MPSLSPFNKSCLALAVAQALSIATADAASIEVETNQEMSINCTLRKALATINAGMDLSNGCDILPNIGALGTNDTIHFKPNYALGRTHNLQNGELPITKSVTINGGTGTAINGVVASRVLNISGAATNVVLNKLILLGGSTTGNGGAIKVDAASVTINDSFIGINRADDGGAIYVGNSANLIINSSTVNRSTATGFGGGVMATASALVEINNSTVSSNSA